MAFYIVRNESAFLGLRLRNNCLTNRSSTAHFVRWTVFKSQFCGFAAQKYSTKLRLKNCRLARRYAKRKVVLNKVVLVLAGLLSACSFFQNERPPENLSASLVNPDKVIEYSINPIGVHKIYTFADYPVLGKVELNKQQASEVSLSLKKSIDQYSKSFSSYSFKCFSPRHALEVFKNGHRYLFLICYQCSNVVVLEGENVIFSSPIIGNPGELNSILELNGIQLAPKFI